MRLRFQYRSFLPSKTGPILVWICLALNVPFGSWSEELVRHQFRSEIPNLRFEDLLYLSAGVELMQEGLSSTRGNSEAAYVLETEYRIAQDETYVRYELYGNSERGSRRRLAVTETSIAIDHSFGMKVAETVKNLIKAAGLETVFSNEARIDGLLSERHEKSSGSGIPVPQPTVNDPVIMPPAEPEISEATVTAPPEEAVHVTLPMVSAPPVAPSFPADTETVAGPVPEDKPVPAGEPARFVSSFSAAGLLLMGRITEFFRYGASGQATAGFTLPGDDRRFTVGARVSFTRMFNDDGVTGGPLYISTAGPDLQFAVGMPFKLSAGVSGGAAILTVTGSDGMMSKTVPYADIGIRALVRMFDSRLYLGGEVRYVVIFDNDIVILGASPALTLHME